MKWLQMHAGCIGLSLAMNASADLVTLDFENLADNEFIDDQYLGFGIDFGGTMQVLNSNLARSGSKEAFGPPFGTTPTRIDAVSDEFVSFGAWFRGHGPGDALTIEAFSALDNSIGSVSFNTPVSGLTHGFLEIDLTDTSGLPFAYIEITITSVGYSMDDVRFELVPAPSSAAALLAFGGFIARRCRR